MENVLAANFGAFLVFSQNFHFGIPPFSSRKFSIIHNEKFLILELIVSNRAIFKKRKNLNNKGNK